MKHYYFSVFGILGLWAMTLRPATAQSVVVLAEPASAQLSVNSSSPSTGKAKVPTNEPNTAVLAFAPGYATQGIDAKDLTGKSHTLVLRKTTALPAGADNRKLEFVKLTDRTGKLERPAVNMGAYGTAPGTSMSDARFAEAITGRLSKLGYSMTGTNALFNRAGSDTDMALGAEIVWFTKDTRGPGFEVSLLVHWSLFSQLQQRVVYEATTGGYTDTQQKTTFNDELAHALQDAAAGIGSDPAFQALIAPPAGAAPAGSGLTALTLPKLPTKTFGSYGEVVRAAMQSTVTIKTPGGHGSGFLISADGYLLTNQHVVQNAEKIEVVFDNGFSFEATVVRADVAQDVALLKIAGKGYKPLLLDARDDQATVGTDVLAIGTPENLQLGQSVTKGIVSGQRTLNARRYLQTDVAISPGNSGGPLLNTSSGAVIGIISAKIKAQGVEGIGFGIPIGEASKALHLVFE